MDTTERQARYFPDADWKRTTPREAGLDPTKLQGAIDHAIASENKTPRDLQLNHQQTFGREPFGDAIGPLKDRGPQTGVILHKGVIVAEWGEPARVDLTNSVTKSMLSTVVGLAHERRFIRSVDDTVREYMPPVQVYNPVSLANKVDRMKGSDFLELFDSEHNRKITWNHLLRQVSDWEGSLWGKPDWCDRPTDPNGWGTRPRNAPGTAYEYNDVRTNVLALAALNVWRRPLPQVLKEYVFDPIGASNTWRWFGYENSWIVLDGLPVQSVSGGGHWGGGMYINAYDMARFGYLGLNRGRWKERQVIPESWIELALTPTPVQPSYGFMNWYNNKDGNLLASAPRSAFGHRGVGDNFIYVDPQNDVVAVLRWIQREKTDEFVRRLLDALQCPAFASP